MQYDFRSVYASLLEQWFCVDKTVLQNVMFKNFQSLPLIKSGFGCMGSEITQINNASGTNIIANYPNPFSGSTSIEYTSNGGHVLIQVFNTTGKLVTTLVDAIKAKGKYSIPFENQFYAPGVYYARLKNEEVQQVRNMLLVR